MSSNETYVCANITQTIVNNNTIVISPTGQENDTKTSDTFCIKRCESYDQLPPPAHCSTPKSKNSQKFCVPSKSTTTPISTWLDELKDCYHPECTVTLQSKSLMVDINKKVKLLVSLTSKVVRTLHHQTYAIAKEFDHIYRCLEMNCTKYIPGLVDDLVNHMVAILLQHSDGYTDFNLYQGVAHSREELPQIVWQLNSLALDFSKRIDRLLLRQMEVLVGVLNSVDNPTAVMSILASFTNLGLQCDHLGSLLSRCDGITTLIEMGASYVNPVARLLALKLLSSVLCAPSAVLSFSEVDGMDQLCGIITDEEKDPNEKKQALAMITQLSNPKCNIRATKATLATIVRSITQFIKHSTCPQTLLLAAIALSNISDRPESVGAFIDNLTIAVLLHGVRHQGPEADSLLKEQVASIIANLSDHPEAITHLCQNRVIPALLCFLNFELSDNVSIWDSPTYRLQHKCALALARLCSEKEAVSQIEQLKGVPKLLALCKLAINVKKDDHRLLACLEALRRILTKNNPGNLKSSGNSRLKTSIVSH